MPDLRKGKYRHYKGNLYEVIDLAQHSETLEVLVVYRPLAPVSEVNPDNTNEKGEHTLWVRPLRMFTENVVVEGKLVPRFEYVG